MKDQILPNSLQQWSCPTRGEYRYLDKADAYYLQPCMTECNKQHKIKFSF